MPALFWQFSIYLSILKRKFKFSLNYINQNMNIASLLAQHRTGKKPDCLNYYLNESVFTPCSMVKAMTLRGHRGCINTCSFNPYGNYELTGCDDGCVWLWDIGNRNPNPKIQLSPHHTNVFTTNFLTGNRFISGGNDATVQCIEISEGRATTTKYFNHHIRKVLCSFVIDENTFATCSHDSTIRLFDIRTQYKNQKVEELPFMTPSDFTYAGHEKLMRDLQTYHLKPQNMGGGLESTQGVNIDNGSLLLDLSNFRNSEFYTMDLHPIDRKRFITSGSDGTVRLFDLRMIKQQKPQNIGFGFNQFYKRKMNVTGSAFDATGERIAASVLGGSIHVLDTASFVDLATIPQPQESRRRGQEVDLNEAIDENGEIDISRLLLLLGNAREEEEEEEEFHEETPEMKVTGEIIELKGGHKSFETIKAVNWFGDYVVTGSDDGRICFYNAKNSEAVQVLSGHRGNVNVVAVHREKELLSTSGIDNFAILWEPMEIGKMNLLEIKETVKQTLEQNTPNTGLGDPCTIF